MSRNRNKRGKFLVVFSVIPQGEDMGSYYTSFLKDYIGTHLPVCF